MKTLLFDPIYIAFADAQDAGRDYQAEHIAFLRAESARTGLNNEPLIVLLYGQEAAHCCCACRKPSHELAPIPAPVLIRLGFTMDAYMRIYNRAMSHDTPPRVAVKCLRVLPYIRAKHRELYNRDIFYLGENRHASAMGR